MINISEFRKQNPQYNDLTDEQISLGIHRKSYSDIPFEKFDRVFRPTTTGDWIKSLAVAPIHGAQESLASIPLQKELEQKSKAKRISELPTGLEEGTPFAKGYYGKAPSFTAITEPLPSPEQKEAAKEYLKTPIQESYAYKFYKQSQEGKIPFAAALGSEDLGYVSGQTSIKPDIQESIPYAAMKGVGQSLGALPFVAFGGGPVGLSVAAIPMMSAEGVSMLERGIQQGIPEEIAVDAATKAKYLGLIDLAGLKLLTGVTKALVKPVAKKSPEVAKQLYQRVWNKAVETAAKHPRTAGTLFGFTDEAVQEIVQEIGANAIAIQDYKEAVSLFNGIKEAGGAGGLAGAILGGLLTALGIKARKMVHPKSPAQIVTPEDIAEKPQEPTAPPGEPTAPFEEVQPTPEEPKRTLLKPPTPDWVTPAPPILKIPPQKEKPVASELQSEVQDVMKRKFGSFNEAAEAALDLEEKIGVKLYPHLRNEDYVLRMSPKLHEEAIQQYQSNRQAALNIITNREALVQEPSGQELSEPRSESVLGKEEVPRRLGEAQLPESITKAVKLHSVGPHMFRGASEVFRSSLNEFFSNVNKPSMPSMPNEMTLDQLYYWLDKYSGQEVPGEKPGKAYIKKEELDDIYRLTSAKDELDELAEEHGGKVKLRDVAEVFKEKAILVNEVIYSDTWEPTKEERHIAALKKGKRKLTLKKDDMHKTFLAEVFQTQNKYNSNYRATYTDPVTGERYHNPYDSLGDISPEIFSTLYKLTENPIYLDYEKLNTFFKKLKSGKSPAPDSPERLTINKYYRKSHDYVHGYGINKIQDRSINDVFALRYMPEKYITYIKNDTRIVKKIGILTDQIKKKKKNQKIKKLKHKQWTTPGGINNTELVITSFQAEELPYDSQHFAEDEGKKNIGWARVQETNKIDAGDTTSPVGFIDEVQSARHQKGKREGYYLKDYNRSIDAPFRKSYNTLLLKRVLMYFADKGFSTIAWTTGEQQISRWSDALSQAVTKLEYDKEENILYIYPTVDEIQSEEIKPEDLKHYVGDYLANKLLIDRVVSGDNIRFEAAWPRLVYGSSENKTLGLLGKLFQDILNKAVGKKNFSLGWIHTTNTNSLQPSIQITPEGLEKLRSNTIFLYSFGLPMLNKLTEDISSQFSKLPKGGISRRLGKLYRQYAGIPYWNAKVAKKLEPVYRVAQSRTNTRNEGFLKSMQGLDKWPKLTSEQKITIAKILNDLDGKQLEAVQAVPYIRREDGKLDLNPKHLEEFQEFLDTKDLDPEVNDYLYNVRLRLLEAHQTYYNYYKHDPTADQTKLEEFIQNTGFIPNYFPHNFYGEAYIEGTDSEGNLVARIPFDTSLLEKLGGKKYIKRIRERIQSDPNLRDLTFSEIKSSDEIEQFWMNSPVPIDVMSRVLDTAINHYKDSPEYRGILASLSPEQEQLAQKMSEKILKTLPTEVAHILKLKGFSHYAKRRGILGYETQDVGKVLYDYMWGLHSSIAKIEAAKEYTKLMYTLKPNKFEHTLLDKFITDNLKPYTSLDRTVDTTRAALAGIYLGSIVKSTFVNISTILTGGIPAVGLHSKSGTLMFPRAAKDIAKQFISELPEQPRFAGIHGKKDPSANHLQQDEINLMVQLLTKGTVQHQMTNELQVNLRKAESKFMNMLQAYTTFVLGGMSMTEWYGRAVTALAAYRAFRDGKIDNKKTLTKYNLTPNQKLDMSDPKNMKKAINFCDDVVNYSFGEFASYNKPLMVRTGKAGKISQIGYTFRFFMHHQLEMWNNMLRHQQGLRGPAMALLSIAHTMALAGIPAGLPLMKVMMNLFSSLTGDDPEKMLREKLPDNETIRDIAMYGLPSVTGVSLGGSYEIGVPEAVEDLLGVAGQIPLDIYRGVRAYQSGVGASRVMEIVFPSIFVRNILNALRGKSEGLYTLRGTPISRPDEEGIPIKYTNTDIIKKVLGFQSLEKAKLWRITQDIEKAEDFRRTKVTQLVDRFMHAYNRNDYQGMIDVYDEVIAWNIKVINDKKPEFVIDLQEGIQRRLSGKPLSGYMRLRKYKAAEAHGLK